MKRLPLFMILVLICALCSCQSLTLKPEPEGLTEIPSGYSFTIAGEYGPWAAIDGANAQGKLLADAYIEVEDELGISISFNHAPGYDQVVSNAFGGRPTADFVYLSQQYWIPLAVKGFIRPLNTESIVSAGLDVTDPAEVDIDFTLASRELDGENVWAMSFSGGYFVNRWGHGLAFNRNLLTAAGYPADELYALVENGGWTTERFAEVCRTVALWEGKHAVDGGQIDAIAEYSVSSGVRFTERNAEGRWVSNADKEGLASTVALFSALKKDPEVTSKVRDNNLSVLNDFALGNLAFLAADGGYFGSESTSLNRVMKTNLGYLPMPVSRGESYLHSVVNLRGFCLETVNSSYVVSVKIMSRIGELVNDPTAAEARIRSIMPDSDSADTVIKYMLPNTVFDSSRLNNEVFTLNRDMMDLLFDTKEDISGLARDSLPAIQKAIDEIFD